MVAVGAAMVICLVALALFVRGVGLLVVGALLFAAGLLGAGVWTTVRGKTRPTFGAAAAVVRDAGSDPLSLGAQVRRVRVNDGYEPAEVHVAAGRPVRLIFRREETAVDSERVVFPDLGLSAELPSFRDVAIELPPSAPGEHEFACPTRTLRGALVVEAAGGPSGTAQRDIEAVAQ